MRDKPAERADELEHLDIDLAGAFANLYQRIKHGLEGVDHPFDIRAQPEEREADRLDSCLEAIHRRYVDVVEQSAKGGDDALYTLPELIEVRATQRVWQIGCNPAKQRLGVGEYRVDIGCD